MKWSTRFLWISNDILVIDTSALKTVRIMRRMCLKILFNVWTDIVTTEGPYHLKLFPSNWVFYLDNSEILWCNKTVTFRPTSVQKSRQNFESPVGLVVRTVVGSCCPYRSRRHMCRGSGGVAEWAGDWGGPNGAWRQDSFSVGQAALWGEVNLLRVIRGLKWS